MHQLDLSISRRACQGSICCSLSFVIDNIKFNYDLNHKVRNSELIRVYVVVSGYYGLIIWDVFLCSGDQEKVGDGRFRFFETEDWHPYIRKCVPYGTSVSHRRYGLENPGSPNPTGTSNRIERHVFEDVNLRKSAPNETSIFAKRPITETNVRHSHLLKSVPYGNLGVSHPLNTVLYVF